MQKCDSCRAAFNWSMLLKSSLWMYKPIECENCHAKHKVTMTGRLTVTAIVILPLWLFIFFLSPFENTLVTLAFGILIAFIGGLLAPYVIQYKGASEE
ncbi:TIGR04104 family putative zinc finger protein [Metabacillus malikii]|uniref:CXXC-20-CXXC protein n=1 Tax=Metabacillus malikii TaxID=1504265 RepID=A0ABT9ZE32_9BACI|nr:TIGR04104 family putative zinc finger protein [Metabacillus malikii]MDQ0230194.1 CXXC-20-CXXC protein [Metabacillus malikii]